LLTNIGPVDRHGAVTHDDAHKEVYGHITRTPIYGMLTHLSVTRTQPEKRQKILPLASQLLLAYAITIFQDDGPRIELCGRLNSKKAPIPSATGACRLVRQMASGLHDDLVQRLPTEPVALSTAYGSPDEERVRGGNPLNDVRTIIRDARLLRPRRLPNRQASEPQPETPDEENSASQLGAFTPEATRPHGPPPSQTQRKRTGPQRPKHAERKPVGGSIELRSSPLSARKQREYKRHGLAPNEVLARRPTLLASEPSTGKAPSGASLSMRIRGQQGMVLDRARANQRLPIDRKVIRDDELAHLVATLCPWMERSIHFDPSVPTAQIEAAAMVTMILLTGATPDELHKIKIVSNEAKVSEETPRALIGQSNPDGTVHTYLWVRAPKPEMDSKRYASVTDCLLPTSEGLHLPIPEPLANILLNTRRQAQTTKRSVMFTESLESITQCMRRTLQRLNDEYHCQLRLADLPGVLPQRITDGCGNQSYAWLICGEGDPHLHTPLVYQTTEAKVLIDAYHSGLEKVFSAIKPDQSLPFRDTPWVHADRHYGSALKPFPEVWSGIAAELRLAIPRAPRPTATTSEHVTHHNAFVTYVLMMSLIGTGIRAVRDPIESSLDIDWDHGLLFVYDKEARAYGNERLLPLAPSLLHQLRAYRDHLQALAGIMDYREDHIADALRAADSGEAQEIPFLHWLDEETHTPLSIGPAAIGDRLQDLFPVPANIGRHHMRSYLIERGCPGEWIDALLGHEAIGMEAYGPYSALSIADLQTVAEQWIEPMLHMHGWVVAHGAKP
jgi:hypothetical protein